MNKKIPQTKATVAAEKSRTSRHICLHVVRPASSDVRATRATSALVDAGFTVTVVDVTDGPALIPEMEHCCMKHIVLPNWRSLRSPWFFVKALGVFMTSVCYLFQSGADIYHASEVTALPACYLVAKLRRKPLVYEAYELPLHDLPLSEMGLLRRCFHALLTLLLTIMIPRCDAVIAVSLPIMQEMDKRYRPMRIALIRNVPVYKRVAKSDRLRQHLGLPPAARIALYQGNLQPDRGLDTFVRAAKFLEQDIVIVMMGQGIGTTQARLEALIASEGVTERVKIIPPVPYEDLLDWTASADLGLVLTPLDYTLNMCLSLPNKFFEYLMAGLPVLASPLIAVQELIQRYDVGAIVSSLEPASIGMTINAMLADQIALARMRRNALDAACDLCWEKESLRLIALYDDIVCQY